jgi:RNA polymerase sigma factor (sigma-70 family)
VRKDPAAWAEFMKRYLPLINFSIKKTLRNYSSDVNAEEDIKDIGQDIVALLLGENKLIEIKNRGNINYWLAIIARNTAINHLKTKHKEILVGEESYFEKFTPLGKFSGAGFTGKTAAEKDSDNYAEKIEAIYNLLSQREKIIFNLYFGKGLALKDVSKITGAPIGTVSSAVTRMRQKLKKPFTHRGGA